MSSKSRLVKMSKSKLMTFTVKIGAVIIFLSILIIISCFIFTFQHQDLNASVLVQEAPSSFDSVSNLPPDNLEKLNNPYPKSTETQYIDMEAYKDYNRTNNTIS